MADSTAPLAGVRDHRELDARTRGHHHPPRRPRRRGHQGRVAAGRLHPRDDLADRRGRVADAPPHQPGQAVDRARPAHARGRRDLPRPRAGRRRRDRGHAPRRPRAPRPRLRAAPRGQPAHRLLHDLGLRHDRPLQGHAEPRHRLRRVGRPGEARGRPRTASPPSPSTRRSASTPGRCSAPSASSPASSGPRHRARAAGSRSPRADAAAAMDWLRSETWKAYERPESEVTGNKSDGCERRAPGTAGMRDGVRYQFYESSDGVRPVPGVRAGVLGELLPRHRPRRPVRGPPGVASTPTTPSATSSCARSCATSSRQRTTAEWVALGRRGQHADRQRQHAQDPRRRPAVPGPLRRGSPRSRSAPTSCRRRSSSSTPSCRCRRKAPTVGQHTDEVLRRGPRLRRRQDRRAPRGRRPRLHRRTDAALGPRSLNPGAPPASWCGPRRHVALAGLAAGARRGVARPDCSLRRARVGCGSMPRLGSTSCRGGSTARTGCSRSCSPGSSGGSTTSRSTGARSPSRGSTPGGGWRPRTGRSRCGAWSSR